MIILSLISPIPPSTLAMLATARTAAETKRLVADLNKAAHRRREEEAAEHDRQRKEIDEQVALTKRLSERGRARRAGSAPAATSPAMAATRNVFDLYAAREAARQRQLAAMSGARR